jgi:putative acetyltransferase
VIRPYSADDLAAVVECFDRSVRMIGARAYTPDQIAVWAPDPPDPMGWPDRLRSGGVFVADVDGRVAGFARADDIGCIDLLYVDPDFEGLGWGRALLETACAWMEARGVRELVSEVSLSARPLFESMGFRVEGEQQIERRGVRLVNFRMRRDRERYGGRQGGGAPGH